MKKLIYTLGLAVLVAFTANAQSKDKKESKKVEYTIKDDQAELTITTEVNGEKKVEHFTGKEAEAKMKEMNEGQGDNEVSKVIVKSGNKSKSFHYDIDIETDDEDGHSKSIVFINEDGEKKKININTSDEKLWVVKDGETVVDLNFKELEDDIEHLGEELSEEIEAIIEKYDVDSKVEEHINSNGTKTITITKEITVPHEEGKSSTKKEETLDIDVYPNPSKDEMTVAWNSSKKTKASIKVTDLNGKTFIEKDMTVKGKHKETLDLKSLPKGTYLVQVQTGDETSTHKIMVD